MVGKFASENPNHNVKKKAQTYTVSGFRGCLVCFCDDKIIGEVNDNRGLGFIATKEGGPFIQYLLEQWVSGVRYSNKHSSKPPQLNRKEENTLLCAAVGYQSCLSLLWEMDVIVGPFLGLCEGFEQTCTIWICKHTFVGSPIFILSTFFEKLTCSLVQSWPVRALCDLLGPESMNNDLKRKDI
jgi:hypothetical protein